MSKLTEIIRKFKDDSKKISVNKPGFGFVIGKVERFEDDVVVIKVAQPENQKDFVIHFTQFCVEKK